MMTHVRYVIRKLTLFHTCSSNVHCLSKLDLLGCMPRTDESFNTWFTSAASHDSPALQKGVKSLSCSPSGGCGRQEMMSS
jgi:hypothetical protein